jgi:hypothetical protein
MVDFLTTYYIFLLIALIGLAVFWGAVIFFIIRYLRSKSGPSTAQKLNNVARVLGAISGRSSGSIDPMETKAGSAAASVGIDLNAPR